jgi:hypothetical protein
MKGLLDKWLEYKEVERNAKEMREQIEVEMYMTLNKEMTEDSQSTWNYDGYKLVIKPNFSVKVNQEEAKMFPDLFKTKYELSYSQYKKSEMKHVIDNIVTISQTKPTFTITLGE